MRIARLYFGRLGKLQDRGLKHKDLRHSCYRSFLGLTHTLPERIRTSHSFEYSHLNQKDSNLKLEYTVASHYIKLELS